MIYLHNSEDFFKWKQSMTQDSCMSVGLVWCPEDFLQPRMTKSFTMKKVMSQNFIL